MEQSRETVDRPASFLRRKYDLFTKSFFHLLLILNDLYEKKRLRNANLFSIFFINALNWNDQKEHVKNSLF